MASKISTIDAQSISSILSAFTEQLAEASTPTEALRAVSLCARYDRPDAAMLLYIDHDADGLPRWAKLIASENRGSVDAPSPAIRRPLSDFPLATLCLKDTNHVLLIGDVLDSPLIDATVRAHAIAENIRAAVFLPLNFRGQLLSVISLVWNKPQSFDQTDRQIYSTVARPIASWVRMLRTAEQEREKLVAELQRQTSLLELVIDSAPLWIFVKDRQFRFRLMNKANRNAFHFSPEDVIGKDDFEIGLPAEQILGNPEKNIRGFRADDSDVILGGQTLHNPRDVVMVDGQERILNTIKLPLIGSDSEIQGLLGIAIDVTQEREREAERERLIKQLIETSRFKDEFLSVMSHELRTPLNAIIGFLGIVLMGDRLEARDRMMLTRTEANADRLLSLINNILDISRIEAGRLEIVPKPLDLRAIVEGLRANLEVLAQQKGLEFVIEIDDGVPEHIITDEDALTKIVSNLLANAIKFTDRGSVRLIATAQENNLRVEVRDTGIGIPAHLHEVIFESFRQGDSSSTRAYGGSGLGLAIVRRLCTVLGGSVRVDSKPGVGSIFTVSLPLAQPLPQAMLEGEAKR